MLEFFEGLRILAEILVAGLGLHQRHKRIETEEDLENQERAAKTGFAAAAPAKIAKTKRVVSLLPTGEATTWETWQDIRPDGMFPELPIPVEDSVFTPDAYLGEQDAKPTKGSSYGVEIYEERNQQDDGWAHRLSTILISGPLDPDSRGVGVRWETDKSKRFCATREEAEEAYSDDMVKQEYTSLIPRFPTDLMILHLEIPELYHAIKLDQKFRAFFEGTELPAEEERKRVLREGGSFELSDGVVKLVVPEPRPGIQYAICWTPPPAVVIQP